MSAQTYDALVTDLAEFRCYHTDGPMPCEPCVELAREHIGAAASRALVRDLGLANLPAPTQDARDAVLAVLSLHRRARNTRACTGCPWTPDTAGGTSDGEATRRRNEDFNTHLAALITALFR